MSSQEHQIPLARKVFSTTLKSFKTHPILFIPFLIFTSLEFIFLILLYLAPRLPLKLIFGPPIRAFWGERYLHYPDNFLLLPKINSLSRMGLSVIVGSLLTGMAIVMAVDIFYHRHTKLKKSLQAAGKKYISLFAIFFLYAAVVYATVKMISLGFVHYFISGHSRLLFLGPAFWLNIFLFVFNFVLAVFIQSILVYALPILIIENKKLLGALLQSFRFFKKHFFATLFLVTLPMLLYIPILIFEINTAFLINRTFPEIVLWILFFSVVLGSLVIEPLINLSAAFLYLTVKEKR